MAAASLHCTTYLIARSDGSPIMPHCCDVVQWQVFLCCAQIKWQQLYGANGANGSSDGAACLRNPSQP